MGYTLALDFGTTNSVLAVWNTTEGRADLLYLPALSLDDAVLPPLIPSLLYVRQGAQPDLVVGQAVRAAGLDHSHDRRLFRNFKRGVVMLPVPPPRLLDETAWGDREAGRAFLTALSAALPFSAAEVDQLVITAPIAAFDHYLDWLRDTLEMLGFPSERVRVVDESTAAALGYAVRSPGAPLLVVDFGGGTLDLSLIQLPQRRERVGGLLNALRRGETANYTARVIAKGGRLLGGSDIDQWLMAEVLRLANLDAATLGDDTTALLTACEAAKIALSSADETQIAFSVNGTAHQVQITRAMLEGVLDQHGFFSTLRHLIDKVMHEAGREGIFTEDIRHVLIVGGTALIPSVQRALHQYFRKAELYADKPFTAVVEGALEAAQGISLEDFLVNSYGLRHLDPQTGAHAYEEIIPMGSRYPSAAPYEVLLGAAHDGQTELEFVIGMIDAESAAMVEIAYEDGRPVFLARADAATNRVIALNEFAPPLCVPLDPPATLGEDRIRAAFSVDAEKRLHVTVTDLKTRRTLLQDMVIVALR